MGQAGAVVGLTTGAQAPIGGVTQVVADGAATGRGCTTNFIGYGEGLTNQVQSDSSGVPIQDFNAADDTVTRAATGTPLREPVYTADILSWAAPTPP